MSLTTRCPACATLFKVVPDQLKVSDGWVRCGECGEVFDASAHLTHLENPPTQAPGQRSDETPVAADPAPVATADRPDEPEEREFLDELEEADDSEEADDRAPFAPPKEDAAPSIVLDFPEDVPAQRTSRPLPPRAPLQRQEEPAAVWLRRSPAARTVLNGETLEPPSPPDASARPPSADRAEPDDDPAPDHDGYDGRNGHFYPEDGEVPSALLLQTADDDEPQQSLYLPAFVQPAPNAGTPEAEADAELGDAAATLRELDFVRVAERRAFWQRPMVVVASLAVCLGLVAVLLLQVVRTERDRLAAHLPGLRPALQSLCAPLGCQVAPLRRVDAVVIDGSSFNKVQGDLFQFEVEVRNTAAIALAMPALELTLTDTQDQPLVRRVLLPADLRAAPELAAGSAWSGSLPVQVRTLGPVAADRVAGYRVLVFYP